MFLGLSGMAAREGGGNAGRKARWLWILVLVGLLASSGPLWQRGALERQNNAVELIFDYDELETLAELADRPLTEVVGTLAPAGITTLAVRPATLNSLLQRSRALAVSDRSLFVSYGMTGMMHPALAPLTFPMIRSGAYIVTRDRETVELLSRAFDSHLPEDWEVNHWEGYYAFYAGAPFQRVSSWSLGYLPGPVGLAQGYGLFIAPRPSNQTIGELPPDPYRSLSSKGWKWGVILTACRPWPPRSKPGAPIWGLSSLRPKKATGPWPSFWTTTASGSTALLPRKCPATGLKRPSPGMSGPYGSGASGPCICAPSWMAPMGIFSN